MSMKRSKKSTNTVKSSHGEGSMGFSPPATAIPTWDEAMADKSDDKFVPWVLSRTFARNELLSHPKFGRGVVLSFDGPRIEVLFADGVRKLAHGVPA